MSTPNDTDIDIEVMLTFSRQVFEAAQNVVASMKDGDRVQIKTLAQTVGLAMSKDPKDIFGFVNHFAHNTTIAYVTRGKKGGVVKGVRPVKVVKVGKKQKALTAVDTVDIVAIDSI